MIVRILILLFIGLITLTLDLRAGQPIYSLAGGIGLPSQPADLNRYWKGGWHLAGGIAYPLTKKLSVGGHLAYSHMPSDAEAVLRDLGDQAPYIRVESKSSAILTVTGRAKLNFVVPARSTPLSPYFFGSLGWFRLTEGGWEVTSITSPDGDGHVRRWFGLVESVIGTEFGAGMDVYLKGWLSTFVEVGAGISFTKKITYVEWVPIRLGISIH